MLKIKYIRDFEMGDPMMVWVPNKNYKDQYPPSPEKRMAQNKHQARLTDIFED